MLVLLYHLHPRLGPDTENLVAWLVGHGETGVGFFFVLSGFVLAWSRRSTEVVAFWWRRFARVYPAYLCALLVAGAVGSEVQLPDPRAVLLVQAWWSDADVFGGAFDVGWTLSVELFLYALFPGLVVGLTSLSRLGRAIAVTLAGVAALLLAVIVDAGGWSSWWVIVFPVSRVPEFALGIVLALELRSGRRLPLSLPATLALWCAGYLALGQVDRAFGPSLGMVVWGLLIAGVASSELTGRASGLRRDWLVRLGVWSYALYLVHGVVISSWVLIGDLTDLWRRPDGVLAAVHAGAIVAASIASAGLLWWLVERPAERRLRGLGWVARRAPNYPRCP